MVTSCFTDVEADPVKKPVAKVSKIMKEAVQVNVNLGHIVRLMVENSTTKTEKEDIVQTFRLVNNYLDPEGIFIFDMNTCYKYREILGDNTFAETREDSSFIWENYYDREEMINEYYLTLFIKEGELFRKYSEIHYQKCYTLDTVKKLLKEAGFEIMGIYDGYTKDELKPESDRMSVIARKL